MVETKKKLYLVQISTGYIEEASLSNITFFLGMGYAKDEEEMSGKQVAEKFVEDITALYKEQFKTVCDSNFCCGKDISDFNFCPSCGKKTKYNKIPSPDQLSEMFRRDVFGTVDGSSPFWWDGSLNNKGWALLDDCCELLSKIDTVF